MQKSDLRVKHDFLLDYTRKKGLSSIKELLTNKRMIDLWDSIPDYPGIEDNPKWILFVNLLYKQLTFDK